MRRREILKLLIGSQGFHEQNVFVAFVGEEFGGVIRPQK